MEPPVWLNARCQADREEATGVLVLGVELGGAKALPPEPGRGEKRRHPKHETRWMQYEKGCKCFRSIWLAFFYIHLVKYWYRLNYVGDLADSC